MLHSIKIKNYRSLKNIELELTPLTVLIGPNASGKSNLLDIFSLFSEAAYGVLGNALNKRGGFSNLVYRSQMQKEISFQFDFSFSESEIKDITRYEIQMQQQGAYCIIENEIISQLNNSDISILLKRESWECHLKNNNQSENTTSIRNNAELAITQVIDANNYPISYQILEELKNWTIYNLAINDDLRIPQWAKSTTRLNSTGDNLIQVLHTIKELYPKTWENIEGHLENIYENFYRIGFPAEGGDGKLWMRFWEKPFEKGKGFSINFLSDGTLRFLCLLAILESPDPPPLICIEEPELGLHPYAIKHKSVR